MGDQDQLLEQINIGKLNLAKAMMSGDTDLIEKVPVSFITYLSEEVSSL